MLRAETTLPRASKVASYSIWEEGHGGMRCFEWVNGFESVNKGVTPL